MIAGACVFVDSEPRSNTRLPISAVLRLSVFTPLLRDLALGLGDDYLQALLDEVSA